jgi:hypothetical protein
VSPSLTVNLGLRWDYDDLTSRGESTPDLNNVQPRVSLNWLATPTSVVRAGAGLYAGKSRTRFYSDAVQFGPEGNQTVTFDGARARAVPSRAPRTATLDRRAPPPGEQRRLFALGLEQPMSRHGDRSATAAGGRAARAEPRRGVRRHAQPPAVVGTLNASRAARRPGGHGSLPVSVATRRAPRRRITGGYPPPHDDGERRAREYAGLYTAARYQPPAAARARPPTGV